MQQHQTNPNSMRAVIYAAKSTEDRHGSIPTQIEDCRAMAQREGWTVIAEPFTDEAFSAYHGNRGPGLAEAMRTCEAEDGAVLIVQHSDRLARGDVKSARHLVEYAIWAIKHGVRLVSVQDPEMLAAGDYGLLMSTIGGMRNHQDSKRKAQAVTAGIKRVQAKGKPFGGVPLGYAVENSIVDGRVVTRRTIDPKGEPIVGTIFEALDRGVPAGTVARKLNALGHRTRRGNDFTARTVLKIARNADYTGAGPYPQIIAPDLFERIGAKINRPDQAAAQARKGGREPIADFVLRRLAFCLVCGRPMYSMTRRTGAKRTGPLYRTYQCRGRCGSRGTCDARPVPADIAEERILAHLSLFVGDVQTWIGERLADRSSERTARQEALDALKAKLAALDRRREERMSELADIGVSKIGLEVIERIDAQRESSREEIADAEAALGEWTGTLSADAILDFYESVVDLVEGRISKANGVVEINAALLDSLAGVWMRFDGETLTAQVQFRPTGDEDLDGIAAELLGAQVEILDHVELATSQLPSTGPRSR